VHVAGGVVVVAVVVVVVVVVEVVVDDVLDEAVAVDDVVVVVGLVAVEVVVGVVVDVLALVDELLGVVDVLTVGMVAAGGGLEDGDGGLFAGGTGRAGSGCLRRRALWRRLCFLCRPRAAWRVLRWWRAVRVAPAERVPAPSACPQHSNAARTARRRKHFVVDSNTSIGM
jgi:hypothetical protein